MKKFKGIVAMAMATTMMFTLAACGNKDTDGKVTNSDEVLQTENERGEVNVVNKPELGITMELDGEYADCKTADLSEDEVNSYVPGGYKGFKIIKEIGGVEHTLSNVIIAKSELASDPQIRGQFPYIYSGDKYTVLVNMQMISDAAVDNETASRLNAGLMTQLTTMFFDESMMVATMNGTVEDATEEVAKDTTEVTENTETAESTETAENTETSVVGEETTNESEMPVEGENTAG